MSTERVQYVVRGFFLNRTVQMSQTGLMVRYWYGKTETRKKLREKMQILEKITIVRSVQFHL